MLLGSRLQVKAANPYNVADGDIAIEVDDSGKYKVNGSEVSGTDSITITCTSGTTTTNVVTVSVATGKTAKIVLKNVSIDVSGTNEKAAFFTSGEGNVEITLEGTNVLKSGEKRAGLEKGNTGTLTITANSENDKLTATGGKYGAGIGGGRNENGRNGNVTGITINGGKVKATSSNGGAGIGGGIRGDGKNIEINGDTVIATSKGSGAGIGGGAADKLRKDADGNQVGTGEVRNIVISGNAQVTATGGKPHENDAQGKGAPGIGYGVEYQGRDNLGNMGKALDLAVVTKDLKNGWVVTKTTKADGTTEKVGTVGIPVNAGGSSGTSQSSETKEQPKRSEFQRTMNRHENSIKRAKPGDKVTITGDEKFNALPNSVMKKLLEKKDVSLEFTYIYQGKKYTILIPAGSAEDNDIPWYGPMYLWSKYGVKVE